MSAFMRSRNVVYIILSKPAGIKTTCSRCYLQVAERPHKAPKELLRTFKNLMAFSRCSSEAKRALEGCQGAFDQQIYHMNLNEMLKP